MVLRQLVVQRRTASADTEPITVSSLVSGSAPEHGDSAPRRQHHSMLNFDMFELDWHKV
jgi:hypothetical protein